MVDIISSQFSDSVFLLVVSLFIVATFKVQIADTIRNSLNKEHKRFSRLKEYYDTGHFNGCEFEGMAEDELCKYRFYLTTGIYATGIERKVLRALKLELPNTQWSLIRKILIEGFLRIEDNESITFTDKTAINIRRNASSIIMLLIMSIYLCLTAIVFIGEGADGFDFNFLVLNIFGPIFCIFMISISRVIRKQAIVIRELLESKSSTLLDSSTDNVEMAGKVIASD